MKNCTKCKTLLPLGEFSKNKTMKDGLSYWCKSCNKIWRDANKESQDFNKRYWYQQNKQRLKEKRDSLKSI